MGRPHENARRRLSIVLLSPAVAPPAGGIASLTQTVLNGLDRQGDVFLVATGAQPARDAKRLVLAAPSGPQSSARLRARWIGAAASTVLRIRPDVVHAMTWRAALPVAMLPGPLRPVLIVEALGTELLQGGPFARAARNFVLRRADVVIAISTYTAGVVHALSGRTAYVIPPAVSPIAVRPPERKHQNSQPVRVLSIAKLFARKGHLELLRAVESARIRGARCTLTIAGANGPLRSQIDYLGRSLGASEWFSLEVDISAKRLEELYRDSDVFALLTHDGPSEFEGFGIVFVEAGLASLPLVAGRSGGSLEAVEAGKGAFVVNDQEEAVDAIYALCADPEMRAEMGSNAKRHAELFLPAKIDGQLAALYRGLVSKG